MKDRIVAHRGNAAEFRENSLKAIQSAIDLGCRYVEVDVQISSDGVPFLMHDGRFFRLTGKDRDSVDISAAGLASLGYATLEDASELLRRHPQVTAFVEVKAEAVDQFGRDEAVRTVAELVDPAQSVIISFDLQACAVAQRLGYRTGAVLNDASLAARSMCADLHPEFTFCDHTAMPGALWAGTTWVAYEVDTPAMGADLIRRGVELLETMNVRRFLT